MGSPPAVVPAMPMGMLHPPAGMAPGDELKRPTILGLLEVARLRRLSALAWVVTWGIFLILVAISFAAIGCLNCNNGISGYDAALDLLAPALAFSFLVPGGVSILLGSISSMRWGATFRDMIDSPLRLGIAWLPGVRQAKRSWNQGRSFLWMSWILGAFTITSLLFADDLLSTAGVDSSGSASYTDGVLGFVAALLVAFLLLRALHHYFFAQSACSATSELVPGTSRHYWQENQLWWSIGTFTLPLDPVVLFILSLIVSAMASLSSASEYATVVGCVAIGGVISMGAGALVAYGYHDLIRQIRGYLTSGGAGAGTGYVGLPPEFTS